MPGTQQARSKYLMTGWICNKCQQAHVFNPQVEVGSVIQMLLGVLCGSPHTRLLGQKDSVGLCLSLHWRASEDVARPGSEVTPAAADGTAKMSRNNG